MSLLRYFPVYLYKIKAIVPRLSSGRRHQLFHMICLLPFSLLLPFTSSGHAQEISASITINPGMVTTSVNPLLFGHNVVFSGNGMWNTQLNDLAPTVAPLVKSLAPTILRFPGGSLADLYIWEDGLGFQTTTKVTPTDRTITLEATPSWGAVQKARVLDSLGGPFGGPFSFAHQIGPTLEGITGLQIVHSAGAEVRPDARSGQPDWVDNVYGIDEHMQFARSIGAQTILTINYGTGLEQSGKVSTSASLSQRVKRAAAWVAYLNGSPTDARPLGIDGEGTDWRTVGYWAQRRAQRGHPEPYGVRYWEIGNEIYGNWETGCTKAQQYATDFKVFATAMKMVDPSLKVGAVGLSNPHGRGDADSVDEWNATVVRTSGDALDFLVLHLYYPSARQAQVSYTSPTWFSAIMAGAQQAITDLQAIRAIITANSTRATQIELAVTEYGIWPADSTNARDYANLARALYDVDLLLQLLQHGPQLGVVLATAWNLHGSNETAAIGFDWVSGTRTVRPPYEAFRLVKSSLRQQLVSTTVRSPVFRTSGVTNVKPHAAVPVLQALATTDPHRKQVNLLVLNRSLSGTIRSIIYFEGFLPAAAMQVHTLHGSRPDAHNEGGTSGMKIVSSQLTHVSSSFTYAFPPHSLTSMEFSTNSTDASR